jgi:DNA invertase Pin-like site-specific DNA recombinase
MPGSLSSWSCCPPVVLRVFAEFERSIIQERIAAGIARARAKGTRSGKAFGRPRLPAERETAVRASLKSGAGIRKTARLVGTGNATVARIAAEMRVESLQAGG